MIRKVFIWSALVLAIVVTGCAAVEIAREKPSSKAVVQFNAFGNAWHTAFDTYRIAKFDSLVRGELVEWEGLVAGVDHTGTAFNLIPLNNNNNRYANFQARIVLKNQLVPSYFSSYTTRVRVVGKVQSASVLGVIVIAKIVKPVEKE